MQIGLGYRRELDAWIEAHPADCLEITAEHFFKQGKERLEELAKKTGLFVHGLGLSLGTPGPLDPARLDSFARVAETAHAQWVSEHVAFTRTADVDLGHLNPVPPTRGMVQTIADHARELSDRCGRPVLLENITSHLQLRGDLSEPEFLNAICDRADCGLLLDVTNVYINSRNHRFDPVAWLRQIDPQWITQLHIVGYHRNGGYYHDSHSEAIQPELIAFAAEVVAYAPVQAIILERDEKLEAPEEIETELRKLEQLRRKS